jgi:hypothetical protein
MNAALDKDDFGGGGLGFSGSTSEGGLAPLDNPPFVMKPQRMGHPVCAGPEAIADPCGMTTKRSKGNGRDNTRDDGQETQKAMAEIMLGPVFPELARGLAESA